MGGRHETRGTRIGGDTGDTSTQTRETRAATKHHRPDTVGVGVESIAPLSPPPRPTRCGFASLPFAVRARPGPSPGGVNAHLPKRGGFGLCGRRLRRAPPAPTPEERPCIARHAGYGLKAGQLRPDSGVRLMPRRASQGLPHEHAGHAGAHARPCGGLSWGFPWGQGEPGRHPRKGSAWPCGSLRGLISTPRRPACGCTGLA